MRASRRRPFLIGLTAWVAIGAASGAWAGSTGALPAIGPLADVGDGWQVAVASPPTSEFWSGVDTSGGSRALYGGFAFSPQGDITRAGWLVRATAGAGRYHYRGPKFLQPDAACGDHGTGLQRIDGAVTFAEALLGGQWQSGALTIKALVGAAVIEQALAPMDPCNAAAGVEAGPKAAIEAWWNITPKLWAAMDLSATTVHETGAARIRLGYRVHRHVAIGLDLAWSGNAGGEEQRLGLLTRIATPAGEIEISGGVSGLLIDPRDSRARSGFYASASLLNRF